MSDELKRIKELEDMLRWVKLNHNMIPQYELNQRIDALLNHCEAAEGLIA